MKNIKDNSLEKLFGKWKSEIPEEGYSSHVQLRTYELYFMPLEEYEIDDLRFMIGQRIGLKYLLPIAITYLKEDILTEGLYYEGDLLSAVFNVEKKFWKKNLKLYSKIYSILLENKEVIDHLGKKDEIYEDLISGRDDFLKALM